MPKLSDYKKQQQENLITLQEAFPAVAEVPDEPVEIRRNAADWITELLSRRTNARR